MKSPKLIRTMDVLRTARWLTFSEALAYSCIKSRNTLLNLIRSGKIYGTKPEGAGEYIVDRESIDRYYNAGRDDALIVYHRLRRVG